MDDFKVVPVKPTEEMTIAASKVGYPLTYQNVLRIWKAMLAAAPEQPSPAETEDDLTIAYMYGYHKGKGSLDREAIRNEVLEGVAALIGGHLWGGASEHVSALIAKHVRSLKSQPAQPSDSCHPTDSVQADISDSEILDWFIPFMNDITKLIEFKRLCTTLEDGVTREAIKAAMRTEQEGK